MSERGGPLQRATSTLGTACSYAYVVVFVVTLYEVFARYVFGRPTSWSIEVCSLLAAVHYLVSALQAQASDSHIRVDTLTALASVRVRRMLVAFQRLVVAAICAVLGFFAIRQAATALQGMERSGTQLNWPVPTFLKALVAIVLVLLAIMAIVQLMQRRPDDRHVP
jgi:TRAP-type C4-dicarboxylate transport system permease small subunit